VVYGCQRALRAHRRLGVGEKGQVRDAVVPVEAVDLRDLVVAGDRAEPCEPHDAVCESDAYSAPVAADVDAAVALVLDVLGAGDAVWAVDLTGVGVDEDAAVREGEEGEGVGALTVDGHTPGCR
jgi:hypothetical protein